MSSLRIDFRGEAIQEAVIVKYQKQKIIKKYFVVHSIKMSNPLKDLELSSEELKEITTCKKIY